MNKFLFWFFIFLDIISKSILIGITKEDNKILNFPLKFSDSTIITEISLVPDQKFFPSISFESCELFLFDSECINCENTNNTYVQNEDIEVPCYGTKLKTEGGYVSTCLETSFKMDQSINIKIHNLTEFWLITEKLSFIPRTIPSSGRFGIKPFVTEGDKSITSSLLRSKLIGYSSIKLEFSDEQNGNMVMGTDIINNKENIEYGYVEVLRSDGSIGIKSISFGNDNSENKVTRELADNKAIIKTENYDCFINKQDLEFIKDNLFDKLIKNEICFYIDKTNEDKYGNISLINCKIKELENNFNLLNLPLEINFNSVSILFNKLEDLFFIDEKSDNLYNFIFKSRESDNFTVILGISFIKRVKIVLDQNLTKLGFYGENMLINKEIIIEPMSLKTILIIVFSCLAGLIIILGVAYKIYKNRKKRLQMIRLM